MSNLLNAQSLTFEIDRYTALTDRIDLASAHPIREELKQLRDAVAQPLTDFVGASAKTE